MPSSRDEILDAALKLPEADRVLIANRLFDTLPDDLPGLHEDEPEFLEELERRSQDSEPTISVADLWKQG